MANRRKPTALKVMQGTDRPDRTPENEPKPSGVPEPPDFLTTEAKKEWRRLAPELGAIGMLTSADRAIFTGYCVAWADFASLQKKLNGMASHVWESEKGYRQVIPEVAMRDAAWKRVMQAGSRIGLDPAARSGLDVQPRTEHKNPFMKHGKRGVS